MLEDDENDEVFNFFGACGAHQRRLPQGTIFIGVRGAKRPHGNDSAGARRERAGPICPLSVTVPPLFTNFSQKVRDFAAGAALAAAIQSSKMAAATRFLFL